MKKIITFLIFTFFSICAFGQVKCILDNPDYEMKYKRTTVNNSDVIMDFTITYHGRGQGYFYIEEGLGNFYDDEGNIYNARKNPVGDRINLFVDIGNSGRCGQYLESGIPIKVRIRLKDVDDFATEFVKINLECKFVENKPFSSFTITNVPIPRE